MVVQFSGIELSVSIVTYIISAVLLSLVIKFFLDKLRMFRSPTVNWLLGIIVAFSVMYFAKIPFAIISPLSIFAICALKISGVKGFLIGIVAAGVYFVFVLPFLLRFLGL
jgi:predicted membrane-bound spermidine synthase